ncbi:hypothetical protein [Streptomyces sp. NPDC020681]|uniref:hypothetical protein n=1 Tax=Streptomyces sp. NPDC020681 TaxID=3365083 RepID=UPI0037A8E79B
MASAAAVAPAAASIAPVPVNVPLESLETVVPVEAPALSTGVPVPVPGGFEAPRHVTGRLLPAGILPQLPLTSELPRTLVELPVENPLGEGNLGVASAQSESSELKVTSPGADVGAPVSAPRPELFGQPEPVLPELSVLAPSLVGDPAAGLLLR